MEQLEVFSEYRPLLFSIAYRMLGTVMEAEDILQEGYLRWQQVTPEEIDSPKSYLSAIVTRLCIDRLRSAQIRREEYIGPWLPEPLITTPLASPDETVELSESLSMAFLILLESLKPIERAVFLLHEVFDYEYQAIAKIVDKSEANCRQIASRARRHIAAKRPRFEVSSDDHTRIVEQFMDTLVSGDVDGLMVTLDQDVTWWSDGGGLPGIAKKPIHGAENVARFVLNLMRMAPEGMSTRLVEINGKPGYITYIDGKPFNTVAFDIVDGRIVTVWAVVNPEKLRMVN